MSNLEEVKKKIDELTSALEVINMPSERETELSGKVVALCNAIGVNLSVDEACIEARRKSERLLILEGEHALDTASNEELIEEVARRMNVAIEDLDRGNG